MNEIESLKEQLQQTQLAYQMAANMSEFKAGFLARTSHEIRSPLNGLIGLHQLILSDLCESPEEMREFIDQAYHAALKMVDVIDEIILVAKAEYGSNPLQMEPVQLSQVLAEVHNLTHMQAQNRSIQLHIAPEASPLFVQADFLRLQQALVNLIDYSITKMEHGTIKVYAQIADNCETAQIYIELNCPNDVWSESVDLLQPQAIPTPEASKSLHLAPQLSSGMKLLLSQNLIETMGGCLEITNPTTEKPDQYLTRLKCSLPLITPPESADD